MNPARLVDIVRQLEGAGISCLVMGGHAVRYYGFDRNTNDFDLHLAPEIWDSLDKRLKTTRLFSAGDVVEGNSWRVGDFRRFAIGTLPNDQEEWLEFWRANHLLPPYTELAARSERGVYGGGELRFLSLLDLIRSKETERLRDWDDIAILEELYDARLLRQVKGDSDDRSALFAQVRSRRGIESFAREGWLQDARLVADALSASGSIRNQALLLPFAPQTELRTIAVPIEPVVLKNLRAVPPLSTLHLTLIEVVRRQYRLLRQGEDRADKERAVARNRSNA